MNIANMGNDGEARRLGLSFLFFLFPPTGTLFIGPRHSIFDMRGQRFTAVPGRGDAYLLVPVIPRKPPVAK